MSYDSGEETPQQYVAKYNPPTPELGKVYQCWEACRSPRSRGILFEIVYLDNVIALGKQVGGDKTLNPYRTFYSTGVFAGFKYNDVHRPVYRLFKEI